jgi:hypothetical protein
VLILQTLEELRLVAPIDIREWLKRNRPRRPATGRTAELVSFVLAGHQIISSSEGDDG